MHSGVNEYASYDAVLLIGDEALRCKQIGLAGFELIFDLATAWYEWQQLPFVFAVWAIRKEAREEEKQDLKSILHHALQKGMERIDTVGKLRGERLGLSESESSEYLQGFNYKLGEREWKAVEVFETLLNSIQAVAI
jgi:chorismate dehydratase